MDKRIIKFYNSITNSLEPFTPIKPGEIMMYVCGPTVYGDSHIGNARPVVLFDTLYRYLMYLGYKVTYISNYTDIDDKIIKVANELHLGESEVSEMYIKAFEDVWQKLNCLPIHHPRVTEHIQDIIDYIVNLLDTGYAYQVGDDVYFRVRKIANYGILSNQVLDSLEVGSRVEEDLEKEDPRDFVLWKKTNDSGIKWPSPFGAGRPGWHTECCVMIEKNFGPLIDIHGGGNDIKFPHHENEIAQAMATNKNVLSNFWIHNGRIDLDGTKMSKSLGNTIWNKDLLERYDGNVLRLLLLSSQYRQLINFKEDLIVQATAEWERINRTYLNLYRYCEINQVSGSGKLLPQMDSFLDELANDLSTTNALTMLQSVVKISNLVLRNEPDKVLDCLKTLDDMFYCLGLDPKVEKLTEAELSLVKLWNEAKAKKDFVSADEYRAQISKLGIKL